MNKKQVGAFLKVMSKDEMRPVLCTAYIDRYDGKPVMVATDGHVLAVVNIIDEIDESYIGVMLRREALTKWYKLATGKSRLVAGEIETLLKEDYMLNDGYMTGEYPKWQGLVPERPQEPQGAMAFNAEYFKVIQDLDGSGGLTVSLYGELAPMVVRSDRGLYMVMPMKRR